MVGLTLDTVLRAGWATWDLTWQDGALAWIVAAALVGALVVASWAAARDAAEVPRNRALLAGLALGPFLALQMLVLQNPAFVSSSGDAALATGVAVVIAADAVALGALGLVLFRRLPRLGLVGATVALSVLAWWATSVTGAGVVAVVLVGQALAVLLLARVLVAPEPTESAPSFLDALGIAAGSLIFGLLVVGYQLHYDKPLPVTNRWLPVVAALLLGTVAIVITPSTVRADADHRDGPPGWLGRRDRRAGRRAALRRARAVRACARPPRRSTRVSSP